MAYLFSFNLLHLDFKSGNLIIVSIAIKNISQKRVYMLQLIKYDIDLKVNR